MTHKYIETVGYQDESSRIRGLETKYNFFEEYVSPDKIFRVSQECELPVDVEWKRRASGFGSHGGTFKWDLPHLPDELTTHNEHTPFDDIMPNTSAGETGVLLTTEEGFYYGCFGYGFNMARITPTTVRIPNILTKINVAGVSTYTAPEAGCVAKLTYLNESHPTNGRLVEVRYKEEVDVTELEIIGFISEAYTHGATVILD